MSNSVSLYVELEQHCFAELSDKEVMSGKREPELKNYLVHAGTDAFTYELSLLYSAQAETLAKSSEYGARLLPIILWSYSDSGQRICDVPTRIAEEHLLDLAIGPQSIEALRPEIEAFDPPLLASMLFGRNDLWQSESQLSEYLKLWKLAFSDALDSKGRGLYFRLWI